MAGPLDPSAQALAHRLLQFVCAASHVVSFKKRGISYLSGIGYILSAS
jgi:hypothetical protein